MKSKVKVMENDTNYMVSLEGHRTGFYVDQHEIFAGTIVSLSSFGLCYILSAL